METLQQIWQRLKDQGTGSDKGDIHSYLPVYEEILSPYRAIAKNVLEIGLFNGASLRLWKQYFTSAVIHGMDCDEQPLGGMADLRPMIAEGEYNIVIGDASSSFDVFSHFRGIKFDVVVEDANHNLEQQLQIYATLKPYMNEGSIYIVEDIQDIDSTAVFFKVIGGQIVDRRKEKGRYDDCLVIIRQ